MYRFLLIPFILLPLKMCAHFIVYTGPEVYHMLRTREGGTCQTGRIDGVKTGFDRIKRYGLYIGGEFLYGSGELKGKDGRDRSLKSDITDEIFEIRFGYTLQQQMAKSPFFIPFGGWGYFREINQYLPPSPLNCKFKDTFNYVVAGFLSGMNFTPLISMGLNFKVRFMMNGESKISDPPFDDVTLMMEDETQYRLELPISYTPNCSFSGLFLQFTPFYEFRHFGGRVGFPFNFRDTKFHLYGSRLSLMYGF